jgi:hypothetical protein
LHNGSCGNAVNLDLETRHGSATIFVCLSVALKQNKHTKICLRTYQAGKYTRPRWAGRPGSCMLPTAGEKGTKK